MAKERKPRVSKEETTREFSPASIERELASLKTSRTEPLTLRRLMKWIDAKASRGSLFSDTIVGSIRWRKSLGRPLAAKRADGFLIEHSTWYSAKVFENGALHYVDILEPHYGLSIWDGSDGGNNYTVHFMTAVARGSNRIKVSFATGIGWGAQTEHTRRVFRRIDPPERYFKQAGDAGPFRDRHHIFLSAVGWDQATAACQCVICAIGPAEPRGGELVS